MTPKQLAHEFFLGIRTALTCAEVSVTEYEAVMERHMTALVAEEREACAKICEERIDTMRNWPDSDMAADADLQEAADKIRARVKS